MNYEGQICRGPMERSSYMLPVSVGCSYNQCSFCTLFKHLSYRTLPILQVEEELLRVSQIGGKPKTVFLGDGNAFGLPMDHLLKVLSLVQKYFPDCQAVNMDATVTNVSQKSDTQLKQLYDMGVRHIYLGIESGLGDVLSIMNKDHTLDQAYREIKRLKNAGLIYDAHIMTGIAGRGRGLENAEHTAKFLNATAPHRIINFSLFLHRSAPLYKKILTGEFIPASETENLEEEKLLLELLYSDCLEYDGFHDFIEFRVRGTLPKDKEKMIQKVDNAIERQKKLPPVIAETDD